MIAQTGGTREATLQLPPARERWEWSCITWTRKQGVRERLHSSYPLQGKGGNGHVSRGHVSRGTREASLQLPLARERWEWSGTA